MAKPFGAGTKPMPGTCEIDGCGVRIYARGICNAHYQRKIKGLSLVPPIERKGLSLALRADIWLAECSRRVDCLIYPRVGTNGYATFVKDDDGKSTARHRAVFQAKNGPIPKWAQIHHACGMKACINPDHLVLASQVENMAEMHGRNEYERYIAHLEDLVVNHHCAGCCCPK